MNLWLHIRIDLPHSFGSINVPNKNGAPSAIHEDFYSIPNMDRSIDSSIFVMRYAMFGATDVLKHIGPTLDRRHLALE